MKSDHRNVTVFPECNRLQPVIGCNARAIAAYTEKPVTTGYTRKSVTPRAAGMPWQTPGEESRPAPVRVKLLVGDVAGREKKNSADRCIDY